MFNFLQQTYEKDRPAEDWQVIESVIILEKNSQLSNYLQNFFRERMEIPALSSVMKSGADSLPTTFRYVKHKHVACSLYYKLAVFFFAFHI